MESWTVIFPSFFPKETKTLKIEVACQGHPNVCQFTPGSLLLTPTLRLPFLVAKHPL